MRAALVVLLALGGCAAVDEKADSGAVSAGGEGETGADGTGDDGTGDGTGDAGSGDAGTGDDSGGDEGTGDDGTGDDGTGDEGTGDDGTGDDGTGDDGAGDEGGGDDGGAAPTDYSQPGPETVSTTTTAVVVDSDCTMDLTLVAPATARGPLVVLGHGFLRAPANVLGWAEHWASWGLTVAVPALCHASAFDTDHAANGEELALLAGMVQPGPVLYAGHSAGGLAAALATLEDSDAVGMVGLDPVDALNLGTGALPAATVPMLGLVGEPSLCNASANGEALIEAAPDGVALRITEADHCDFESPTDVLCQVACPGTNTAFSDAEIASAVRGLSTAALLDMGGLITDGADWLDPSGAAMAALLASGQVQSL